MDNKHDILELLRQVADGKLSPENAMLELDTFQPAGQSVE